MQEQRPVQVNQNYPAPPKEVLVDPESELFFAPPKYEENRPQQQFAGIDALLGVSPQAAVPQQLNHNYPEAELQQVMDLEEELKNTHMLDSFQYLSLDRAKHKQYSLAYLGSSWCKKFSNFGLRW